MLTLKIFEEEIEAKRKIMRNKKKTPTKPEAKVEVKQVAADSSDAVEEVFTVDVTDQSVPMDLDEEAVVAEVEESVEAIPTIEAAKVE
jgi:hypothetical protein